MNSQPSEDICICIYLSGTKALVNIHMYHVSISKNIILIGRDNQNLGAGYPRYVGKKYQGWDFKNE